MVFCHPITSLTIRAIQARLQAQTQQIDDKQSKAKMQTELIKSVLPKVLTAVAVKNNNWDLFY